MNAETVPLISVIVPVYNVESFLEQCLDSIANQSLTNIEIICVDDGSTDSSAEIIDRFAHQDRRFIAIHKENSGYGKGINTGLEHARGDYVSIVESDDYIDPTMLEKLMDAAKRHGMPDVVKASYWRVCNADTPDQKLIPAFYYHKMQYVDTEFTLDEDSELLFHHPSIWTAIYKRTFLREKAIRMKEVPGAGWVDNPFLIETLAQAQSIVYIDELVYYYREFNVGSSSNVKDPSVIYDRWLEMDDIIKRLKIDSRRILEGHYNRGCAYIEMLDNNFDTKDPSLESHIQQMIERIDYCAVMKSSKILKNYKKALKKHIPLKTRIRNHLSC